MVSTTRVMSCRTPDSRSGVPIFPCRYFEATMLVAVMDQSLGTSTFFCSKIGAPCASVMSAVRSSHSTSSYGDTPALVKNRLKVSPGAFFLSLLGVALVVLVVVSGWAIVNFTFSVPFSFAASLVDSLVKGVIASFSLLAVQQLTWNHPLRSQCLCSA